MLESLKREIGIEILIDRRNLEGKRSKLRKQQILEERLVFNIFIDFADFSFLLTNPFDAFYYFIWKLVCSFAISNVLQKA